MKGIAMKLHYLWVLGLSAILGLGACGEQKVNPQQTAAPAALISENKTNQTETDEEETSKPQKTKKSAETVVPTEPVDINTASASELIAALKGTGVGKAKVEKIIEYREQHNGFKSIDELNQVKGIGDKTLEKMRNRVTISSNNTQSQNKNTKKVAPITETEEK